MKLGRAMAGAEARLGHGFARPELLIEALTHPSFAGAADNQRLEFLGDRVLGLVIAEALLADDPGASRGRPRAAAERAGAQGDLRRGGGGARPRQRHPHGALGDAVGRAAARRRSSATPWRR